MDTKLAKLIAANAFKAGYFAASLNMQLSAQKIIPKKGDSFNKSSIANSMQIATAKKKKKECSQLNRMRASYEKAKQLHAKKYSQVK